MERLRALGHFVLAVFDCGLKWLGSKLKWLGSKLKTLLSHPVWVGVSGIIAYLTLHFTIYPVGTKQAPPPGNTNTIHQPLKPLEGEGKQNPQSGKCESYTQFRVLCENANVHGGFATISILPCDVVRIDRINISDASGHDYGVDLNATTFQVPPGNNDKSSNTEIFYTSLSDGRERVKSILVNKFGQCAM